MSAATGTLVPSQTLQLSAIAKDISGQVLSRTFAWSSSDPAKATVSSSGFVSGVAPGPATITAAVDGKSATTSVTVLDGGVVSSIGTTLNPMSGVVQIIVPDSAVLTPINVSVVPSTAFDNDPRVVRGTPFEFGPSGITFAKPVTIRIKYDPANLPQGTEEAALQIHLSVPPWQPVESSTVDTVANVVTAQVSHFSTYAILTPLPVATVTIRAPPAQPIVNGVSTLFVEDSEQLTATLTDSHGGTLSHRAITWATSDAAIASVTSGGLVAAIKPGSATVSASAGGVTSNITVTVTPVPVATVTVSVPTTPMVVGGTQQLTAVTKDALNNTLTGRTITWVSSNTAVLTVSASGSPATVTAVGVGTATITATSETVNSLPTPTITVNSSTPSTTLLHVSTTNSRYFENATGQIVYLTGSHTWSSLQDNGTVDPPPGFNYAAYLDFLESHHHNFFRLWAWEQSKWTAEIAADYWIVPGPFLRTGSTNALDGKPQFDLTQFNQAYFDRLRSRVQDAGSRGIYVSVMLFDGWSVAQKGGLTLNNPWKGHPFNAANNINGVDGDTDHDGQGLETQTLGNSGVTAIQDAYVRKVIDAVGDLDNVLYEIDNEGDPSSRDWQYHMIQLIRDYEATKGKQHPIGMTAMWPGGSDADLTASAADWISIPGSLESPATATGTKVLIADTDHICGICGSTSWVWKTFAKGLNPILMDGYDGAAIGLGAEDYTASDPVWEAIRKNLGYARDYALRLDLKSAVPHGDLVLSEATGYCLAKPGSQYLVYLPMGGSVRLDLSAVTGTLSVEWLDPASGVITQAGTVGGGSSITVPAAPFGGPSILFLH